MPGGALDEGGAFGVRVSPERTIEPWRVQFHALNSAWSERRDFEFSAQKFLTKTRDDPGGVFPKDDSGRWGLTQW
ncbi:MAG: hypothetical protein ACJA1W_003795 [Akkermansiaceae bacterium]|jgi:hypothetical protein